MGWLDSIFGREKRLRSEPIAEVVGAPSLRLAERTGPGTYRHDAVGESFHMEALWVAWRSFPEPEGRDVHCEAELRREPTNPHDPNAVAIYITERHVAYLPAAEAVDFAKQADALAPGASFRCRARMTRWTDGRGNARFDVAVYFGFPLALAPTNDQA